MRAVDAAPGSALHAATEQRWQQVAAQRLKLRDTVSVDRLRYRGVNWYVLRNQLDRQQFRVDAGTYRLLSHLDGQRTLAESVALLSAGEQGSTDRNALLALLLQLHTAEMLASDAPQDPAMLVGQRRRRQGQASRARWFRLLSPRFALLDPDHFLERTLGRVRWVFSPVVAALMLVLLVTAGLTALIHWDALLVYGAQRADDPRSWLLLACLYPLIKAAHELGHGYAAKRAGAAVNEMGITLLVFLPVPYVDASAASVLPAKRDRMLVGAAGILVELVLSAAALLAWLALPDGLVRDAAFATLLIGGLSTLLFNGNPLLRFDGYYVLSDAIEVPNLASRSARYYGYLYRRYLLGMRHWAAPVYATGERRWFVFFGAASTLYRISISIAIAVFLVNAIPLLGLMLAAWMVAVQLLFPLVRQLRFLLFDPALSGSRPSAWLRFSLVVTPLLATIALLPAPRFTVAEGVVMMPEHAVVRAGVGGFMRAQHIADGDRVSRGDLLFSLDDPEIDMEIQALKAHVRELRALRDALGLEKRSEREIRTQRLRQAVTDLAELRQRHAGLVLRSPADGIVRLSGYPDPIGRWIEQGGLLAYIADQEDVRIRVAAGQEDAVRIQQGIEQITVRLAGPGQPVMHAELLREIPAGSDLLPSAALGSRGGGSIPVDARDERGMRTLHNVYAFDIRLPYMQVLRYVGRRAHVRFDHPAQPVLSGIQLRIRRFLVDEFRF